MADPVAAPSAYGVIPAREPQRRGSSWWVPIKSDPRAALRLVCLPFAGGSATTFLSWPSRLTADVEIVGVQLPGRGSRLGETPIDAFDELIPQLGAAVASLLTKPIALFGHSLGALLAFEISRWLRRDRGVAPLHLFVSGRRAPQIPIAMPITSDHGNEEFIAYLATLHGTPGQVLENTELMRLMLPALRADFRLAETYAYTHDEPLSCPVTAFGGTEDEESHNGRLEAWGEQTTASFQPHLIAGNHFFIHSREQELVSAIDGQLRHMTTPQHRT